MAQNEEQIVLKFIADVENVTKNLNQIRKNFSDLTKTIQGFVRAQEFKSHSFEKMVNDLKKMRTVIAGQVEEVSKLSSAAKSMPKEISSGMDSANKAFMSFNEQVETSITLFKMLGTIGPKQLEAAVRGASRQWESMDFAPGKAQLAMGRAVKGGGPNMMNIESQLASVLDSGQLEMFHRRLQSVMKDVAASGRLDMGKLFGLKNLTSAFGEATAASRTFTTTLDPLKQATRQNADAIKKVSQQHNNFVKIAQTSRHAMIGLGFSMLFNMESATALGTALIQLGFGGFSPLSVASAGFSALLAQMGKDLKEEKKNLEEYKKLIESIAKSTSEVRFEIKGLAGLVTGRADEINPFLAFGEGAELIRDALKDITPDVLPFEAIRKEAQDTAKSLIELNQARLDLINFESAKLRGLRSSPSYEALKERFSSEDLEQIQKRLTKLFAQTEKIKIGFASIINLKLKEELKDTNEEIEDMADDNSKLQKEIDALVVRIEKAKSSWREYFALLHGDYPSRIGNKRASITESSMVIIEDLTFAYDKLRAAKQKELDETLAEERDKAAQKESDAAAKLVKEFDTLSDRIMALVPKGKSLKNMLDANAVSARKLETAIINSNQDFYTMAALIGMLQGRFEELQRVTKENYLEEYALKVKALNTQFEQMGLALDKEGMPSGTLRGRQLQFKQIELQMDAMRDAGRKLSKDNPEFDLDKYLKQVDAAEQQKKTDAIENSYRDIGESAAKTFTSTFVNGIAGIMRGNTEAFKDIGLQIGETIIRAVLDVFVKATIGDTLQKAFGDLAVSLGGVGGGGGPVAAPVAAPAAQHGGFFYKPSMTSIAEHEPEMVFNKRQMQRLLKSRGGGGPKELIVNINSNPSDIFQKGFDPSLVRGVINLDMSTNGPIRKAIRLF